MRNIAIVLAGGVGVKLWPKSREQSPKQLEHFLGDGTLIQNTVFRLLPVFDPSDIFVVAQSSMCEQLQQQLPSLPEKNIICEPFGRNTAPAVLLGATIIKDRFKHDDDIVVTVVPADHVITNVTEFQVLLNKSIEVAVERNAVTSLGVIPLRPDTSYGYLQCERLLDESAEDEVLKVLAFAEKPDEQTAMRFLKAGDFLWNTGIFSTPLDVLFALYEHHLPEHSALFGVLLRHINKETWPDLLENAYRQARAISIDKGIMEREKNVYVIEGAFGWSDLGSWDEMHRLSFRDQADNVLEGNVVAVNCKNNYISAQHRMIATIDVDDIIVVDSEDSVLICRRGKSQNVKEIINFLRRKGMNRFL